MYLQDIDKDRLDKLFETIGKNSNSYIGYTVSKDFNYEGLFKFLKYLLNNIGALLL